MRCNKVLFVFLSLFLGSPSAGAAEQVSLQLKWMHQFQFAGYYVALEKGYFKEAGFDVTINERNPKTSPLNDVLEGRADFGIADSSIVLHRLLDKKVVIASTIFQSSPLVLMSLKSANITSPYDLVGKRIMYQRSVDDASIQAMLQLFNISSEQFTYIPHNFNNWALVDEQADVLSAYLSNQPHLYRKAGYEVNVLDPSSYGIDFYGDLIFTTESRVRSDMEGVKRFVEAARRGWQDAVNNPEQAIDLILNKYSPDADREKLQLEAKSTQQLIKERFVPIGTVYPERFDRIAQAYIDLGMASAGSSIDGLLLSDHQAQPFQLSTNTIYVLGEVETKDGKVLEPTYDTYNKTNPEDFTSLLNQWIDNSGVLDKDDIPEFKKLVMKQKQSKLKTIQGNGFNYKPSFDVIASGLK